jgi:hypothetical protein
MASIHCVNEDLELQRILEINPDLIPGDQINPADPRRWLIVKREMPVPDPGTGDSRWSIDLFFVDQNAMPTFIECKRYKDTRARREVVGQMLEYAANGHYYWSKDEMREFAEQAALRRGLSLEEEVKRLQRDESDSVDEFFQRVQDNLREGQVRLVFFMEEAPAELKSVVDFLNKQMERSEVLLVEARQYEHPATKIVAPTLFGFTEEAREVKKIRTVTTGQRGKWDKASFFNDAKEKLSEEEVDAIHAVLDKCQDLRCELSWGTGKTCGSFSVKWPHLAKTSIFSVYSDGRLTINYGNFAITSEQKEMAGFLMEQAAARLGLSVPEDYQLKFPSYSIGDWAGGAAEFIQVLESLHQAYPAPAGE